MLGIYASSFMTATRLNEKRLRPLHKAKDGKIRRGRWIRMPHSL